MLLAIEHDPLLPTIKESLPPSQVRQVYLRDGDIPLLDTKRGIFGDVVTLVHLGTSPKTAERFIASLKGDTGNIILVSPIAMWSLYSVLLHSVDGIQILDTFDSRDAKVDLVQVMTGLGRNQSSKALKILKYSFSAVEKNLDILRWCSDTGTDVEIPLNDNETSSYTDILYYLTGSPKHTQEKFLRTLAKYRYGHKSIIKYCKKALDQYLDSFLYGEEDPSYTSQQLSRYLHLEDALILRQVLDRTRKLEDLLEGEVMK